MKVSSTAASASLLFLLLGFSPLDGQIITDFSPALGTTNDTITINGSGLTSDTIVQFWNKKTAQSFVSVVGSKLIATVPSGVTTGPISVHQPGGQTNFSSADFSMIGNGPYITSLSTAFGAVGDPLTIFGVHFLNPNLVNSTERQYQVPQIRLEHRSRA